MVQEILLRKRNAILVDKGRGDVNINNAIVMSFQAEVMRLGYVFSKETLEALSTANETRLRDNYTGVIATLRMLRGDDVEYVPFYPNFPRQVMEASDLELFINAICHYWTFGQWRPNYTKEARLPEYEHVDFQVINLATSDDLDFVFGELLSANGSITDTDRNTLLAIMERVGEKGLTTPENIPFKENLCWFVGECLQRGWNTLGMDALKTATDVLRVATHLSGGDVSLTENSKFRNFKRPERRAFVARLEAIGNIREDVFRHRGKWVRLAHALHVGDYAATAPKTANVFRAARDGSVKDRSVESQFERLLAGGDRQGIVSLLKTRPGVFARKLDFLLRKFGPNTILTGFFQVAEKVDVRVLVQLLGHFKSRTSEVTKRVVSVKSGRMRLLDQRLPALSGTTVQRVIRGLTNVLEGKFADREAMGNVYIEPEMADCPVPLQLRKASEGLVTVARGTRMPIGEKGTIRMFIYWKGRDIDLSGSFYNKDFTQCHDITYYNLRSSFAYHSGDITSAPNGAAEFIDVNIDKALKWGFRYLAMSVLVYSGPNFNEHEVCYAGWMTRDKVQSNEIFDPKTVSQRVDLQCTSTKAIPVIFDLQERQAIWLDLSTGRGYGNLVAPNNAHVNRVTLYDIVQAALNMGNKPTLHELFTLHANSRGVLVDNPDDADVRFGWNGDVKPSDATKILSEYL